MAQDAATSGEDSQPQNPTPLRIRAGDADRQQALEVAQQAFSEGKLNLQEYQERSDALLSARYLDELMPLVADVLPAGGLAVPVASEPVRSEGAPGVLVDPNAEGSSTSIALMGSNEKRGQWTIASSHYAGAVMGGVVLDLREATFTSDVTDIQAYAFWGGVEIIVPPNVQVDCDGFGLMGRFAGPPLGARSAGPLVRVRGMAVMGGVEVKTAQIGDNVEDDEA